MSKDSSYFSGEKYNLLAKKKGYRSRAAFKLIQINKKEKLFSKDSSILDLGSAPGGWCQIALENIGPSGSVIGVDILEMEEIRGVKFINEDLRKLDLNKINDSIDIVLSDIAPNISGIAFRDANNMIELLEIELSIVDKFLVKGGKYLAKCFEGDSFLFLQKEIKQRFNSIKRIKPEASRLKSNESYILGLDKK
ncbi:MAG: SAM-dependent methyltransferase [Gammaproteobacteria bacterium]